MPYSKVFSIQSLMQDPHMFIRWALPGCGECWALSPTLYSLQLSLRKGLRAAEIPAQSESPQAGDLSSTFHLQRCRTPCVCVPFRAFPSFQHHWVTQRQTLIAPFSSSGWLSIILHSQGTMWHMQSHVDFTMCEM